MTSFKKADEISLYLAAPREIEIPIIQSSYWEQSRIIESYYQRPRQLPSITFKWVGTIQISWKSTYGYHNKKPKNIHQICLDSDRRQPTTDKGVLCPMLFWWRYFSYTKWGIRLGEHSEWIYLNAVVCNHVISTYCMVGSQHISCNRQPNSKWVARTSSCPFDYQWLHAIVVWIINYNHNGLWDVITYPCLKLNLAMIISVNKNVPGVGL